MKATGTILIYENGAMDLVVEWKIDFFTLLEEDRLLYSSPTFSFDVQIWWLIIFPNGSSRNDTSGHVELWLLKSAAGRSVKQSFSLSLKTVRGERYNEHHYTKDFDSDNWFQKLDRFIPRSELIMKRSILVLEGVLTVVCTMKNTIYVGSESNFASASAQCCHCKGTFNVDSLPSHQKKCMHRSIKCPNCLEVVVLRTWIEEHECQQERPEAVIMTAKFMKIWTVNGKKKAVTAVNLQELKQKGLSKLDLSCSPDDLTVCLEDGTEIDEDDIYYMLPDGTVFFLCQEGDNPSQLNMTSPTNFETNTSSLLDGSESTLPTQRICDLNECAASKKPWPKNFTINFDKCSEELKKQMNKGISYLNLQTRHELLNIIEEEISHYTLHPDIKQRKQVAAHLIEVYPSLKSGIDDGLSKWAERIYDKMKGRRLKIGTAESKSVRKNKKKISSEYIKVPHRCESNFLPTSVISPEEELSMISWMKEEAKKPLKDQDKEMINQYLFATFPTRRNHLIKNIMPFKDLKENYPFLFTSDNLIKQFKNLQDIDIGVWIKNFKNCADKIISEANKKQKSKNSDEVLTPLRQKRASALVLKSKIFSYYEDVDTSEIRHTLLCAFLLLPIVLHDEAKNLYRIIMPDCPIENVAADTSTPVIIFIGNPFDSTELYICGENIILVNDINDAVTAITVLFCLYYVCNIEYPPNCLSTFLFFQSYLLELHYGKKLPPKLINLTEKF